jgi:hypothetical protein
MAVSEVANKTRLTMTFSGTSDSILIKMLSSIMGILMKKTMINMLKKDLDEIKEFVEKS